MQLADLCCASSRVKCSLYAAYLVIPIDFALTQCSPALPETPGTIAGKPPAPSKPPNDLSKDVLKLALNAAVLSSLAYKTPMEVEYLRQKAKGKNREQAKKCIFEMMPLFSTLTMSMLCRS
jgi:hypothetical protein